MNKLRRRTFTSTRGFEKTTRQPRSVQGSEHADGLGRRLPRVHRSLKLTKVDVQRGIL